METFKRKEKIRGGEDRAEEEMLLGGSRTRVCFVERERERGEQTERRRKQGHGRGQRRRQEKIGDDGVERRRY
ncbi:hypothetical protein ACOSQ4_007284 [Xanthoceras sorbifolium]